MDHGDRGPARGYDKEKTLGLNPKGIREATRVSGFGVRRPF